MRKNLDLRTIIALGLIFAFLANTLGPVPVALAQDFSLPAPGTMVALSPAFNPPVLKGIKVHPANPFRFDFILDRGDSKLSSQALEDESTTLIKYFLASLTIPEKDLWVNLSPYEKNRIIPQSFGLTEMGRDLLAEDYMLKQITASLIYPEGETGKKFWKRVYREASKKFGTTNILVNTFNKVWIVPEKAVVYENARAGTAYIVESKLKVMLEQDYLALSHSVIASAAKQSFNDVNSLGPQIVRQIVIPELTKEVNFDRNFAQLRQVYNSLILATWYKKKIKDSILEQVYGDKKKIAGVNIDDPRETERIYERYLESFKKGAYNYIKEETNPLTQVTVPRKYFSGGMGFDNHAMVTVLQEVTDFKPNRIVSDHAMLINADVEPAYKPNQVMGLENSTEKNLMIEGPVKDSHVWDQIFGIWMAELDRAHVRNPVFMIGGHLSSGKTNASGRFQKFLERHGRQVVNINEKRFLKSIKILIPIAVILVCFLLKKMDTINHTLSNINTVVSFRRHFQSPQNDGHKDFQLKMADRSLSINKGAIIILDCSAIKNMFPTLNSISAFFDVEPERQKKYQFQRNSKKRLLYRQRYGRRYGRRVARLYTLASLKYRQNKFHKDVIDSFRESYDYLLIIGNDGTVKMYRQEKDGAMLTRRALVATGGVLAANVLTGNDRLSNPARAAVNNFMARAKLEDLPDSVWPSQKFQDSERRQRGRLYERMPDGSLKMTTIERQIKHLNNITVPHPLDMYRSGNNAIFVSYLDPNKYYRIAYVDFIHGRLIPLTPQQMKLLTSPSKPKDFLLRDLTFFQGWEDVANFKDEGEYTTIKILSEDEKTNQIILHANQGAPFGLEAADWQELEQILQSKQKAGIIKSFQFDKKREDIILDFDAAMKTTEQTIDKNTGGIDLTPGKTFSVQNNGRSIKFHIDPAMLEELQNAPGFVPVIINIRPMTDIRAFLGLTTPQAG